VGKTGTIKWGHQGYTSVCIKGGTLAETIKGRNGFRATFVTSWGSKQRGHTGGGLNGAGV